MQVLASRESAMHHKLHKKLNLVRVLKVPNPHEVLPNGVVTMF